MSVMKKEQIHAMTEGAVMVAVATVLSLIRFIKFPFGGSVTLLSMFPIILYSIRRGVKKGLFASFVYAVLQLLLEIGEIMTWGLTPGVLVACFLLDYLIPFTLIGLGDRSVRAVMPDGLAVRLLLSCCALPHITSPECISGSQSEKYSVTISPLPTFTAWSTTAHTWVPSLSSQ